MKRDHLVPRIVTTANGQQVTRWVRPDVPTGGTDNLPAPAPAQTQADDLSLTMARNELANMMSEVNPDEFSDADDDEDRNDRYVRFQKKLTDYSPETIYALEETMFAHAESHRLLADVIGNEEPDLFVMDLLNGYDALLATSENDPASEDYAPTFYALEFYPQMVPYTGGGYPEARKRQVEAMVIVTDGIERMMMFSEIPAKTVEYRFLTDPWKSGAVIADSSLAALVLEHPDEAHRIVDLLRERGVNSESIRAALEHEVTSLSEGTL